MFWVGLVMDGDGRISGGGGGRRMKLWEGTVLI